MFSRRRGKGGVVAVAASLLVSFAAPAAPVSAASVITVTTTAPGINTDSQCSLQEAIYAANLDASQAPNPADPLRGGMIDTACAAGVGVLDTIVLPASAVFSMTAPVDDPDNPVGPTATPFITSTIILEANGSRIERTGSAFLRAFAIGPAAALVLRNAHVKNFYVRGGDGGQLGGGGGLGAGGAIYVKEGNLVVENSTFEGNRAEGGNGGDAVNFVDSRGSHTFSAAGGGGGGLSGSGGQGGLGYSAPSGAYVETGAGGGGGGARGNGGAGDSLDGGGGGGTWTDADTHSATGGDKCGGIGGTTLPNGDAFDGATGCDGGGGGGGGDPVQGVIFCCDGVPGGGGYGGGGGGGGRNDVAGYAADGARGGFGGGGGAGGSGGEGGGGGFGAGGGGGWHGQAPGGTFGGHGGHGDPTLDADQIGGGGGGAGLGGAIFVDYGLFTSRNSTFFGNSVSHGFAGTNAAGDPLGAANGADAGAAIFAVDGTVKVNNTTISSNAGTGSAAGLAMYHSTRDNHSATLELNNTIVANNGANECQLFGSVSASGGHNLFTFNANCPSSNSQFVNPGLAPLAIEAPGDTPTMAITAASPAFDAGDDDTCEPLDQRGVSRPRQLHCDIGAYEFIKPSADLAVSTTALNTPVAGGNARFLVQLDNNGPTAAQNVVLAITPPTGTTFVSITGSGGLGCSGSTSISCTSRLLSEGASALLTLTVAVPATTPSATKLTVGVTASSTTPDPAPANNAASTTVATTVRADLAISMTGPSGPVAGTNATYTITVTNNGPSVAPGGTVNDAVPAGTTFQSVGTPIGGACTKPAVGATGLVSCTIGSLTPGGSSTFSMTVRLDPSAADGGSLCDTAAVTGSIVDPVTSDDSATVCGTVRTSADLALSETVATVGKPGKGTATFTLVVVNNGPSSAQNVTLSATSVLFSGPKPTTTTTQGAACSVTGQTVSCSWTTLASGAGSQVVISVPWRSSVGQVCTNGSVTAGTPDPNPANNTAVACIGKR